MNVRPCLVCTSPTRNAHLGVDACRACAAFYKRTLSSGKEYTCRQGTGKCRIRKNERFLCRKCRFDRCVELKMQYGKEDESELEERVEGDDPGEGPSAFQTQPVIDCPKNNEECFVKKLMGEYRSTSLWRKEQEVSLRQKNPSELIRVMQLPEEIFLCKSNFASENMRIFVEGILNFARNCFPSFAALSAVDQLLILTKCKESVFLLESIFLTKKYFNDRKYFMISLTTVFHTEVLDFFVSDNTIGNKEDLKKAMKFYTEKQTEVCWALLEKAKFTDEEIATAIAILMWQFGNSHSIPSHLAALGDSTLSLIYSSLHQYYRSDLGLIDYSTRLGNLYSLIHSMSEASALMEEEFTLYSLLHLFRPEAFINQLFA